MGEIAKFNSKGMEFISKAGVKSGNRVYLCRCPRCGNIVEMYASHYYRGSNSCHCLDTKNNRLYSIWSNMKTRCYNENSPVYSNYGQRGITVCDEWKNDFIEFESWSLSKGYKDSLTLDRIDNNKGYYPSNCRWVTYAVQANNKRNNIQITIGNITKNLKEWCREMNLNYKTEHTYISRNGIESWKSRVSKRRKQ